MASKVYDSKGDSVGGANIKAVPIPKSSGYPNNIASTQTVKVRGTGAQTKATKCSKKLG